MKEIVTTKFIFMPNAGYGKEDQFPIISPIRYPLEGIPEANYDLYGINCGWRNDSFVVFARPQSRFGNEEVPGINRGDIINLYEFIYDTLRKRYANADCQQATLIAEIDLSHCHGLQEEVEEFNCVEPEQVAMVPLGPSSRALFNEFALEAATTGYRSKVIFAYRKFLTSECRTYFFPECHGECHCN